MGHGVAQVTAQAGYQVLAIESSPAQLEAGYVCTCVQYVCTCVCVSRRPFTYLQ
jgi:hypothetical protein